MANRQTPLEQAKHYEAKGDWARALDAYAHHLTANPTDARARLRLGELQEKQGKTEQALETFRTVARLQADQGFSAQAVAVLRRVLKVAPGDVRAATFLSELLFDAGKKRDAAEALTHAAQALTGEDTAPQRLNLLERAAQVDPTSLQVTFDLYEALLQNGKKPTADQLLKDAVERARGTPASVPHLRVLERLHESDPTVLKVAWEAARMALELREPVRALRVVRQTLDSHPDDANLVCFSAEALELRGDTARALLLHREAARRLGREGRRGDAQDAWRKVLDASPNDAEARAALGMSARVKHNDPLSVLQAGEVDSVLASLSEAAPPKSSSAASDDRELEVSLDELPVLSLDVDPVPGGS